MEHEELQAWLQGLKVGDKVLVTSGHNREHIERIDRVTPAQIVIGYARYRRKDGSEVGGDRFWSGDIRPTTPAAEQRIAAGQARAYLGGLNWYYLKDADALEIERFVRERLGAKGQAVS